MDQYDSDKAIPEYGLCRYCTHAYDDTTETCARCTHVCAGVEDNWERCPTEWVVE